MSSLATLCDDTSSRLFWSERADMRHHAIEVVDATTKKIKLAPLTTLISTRAGWKRLLPGLQSPSCPTGFSRKRVLFSMRRHRFFHPPTTTTSVCSRITQLNFSQLHSPPARARCRHSTHAPATLPDLWSVLTEIYYINKLLQKKTSSRYSIYDFLWTS